MKVEAEDKNPLGKFKERLIKTYHNNTSVLNEATLTNVQRIYYLSIIGIVLRILILLTFKSSYEDMTMNAWSQAIFWSHIILLIFMIGFFLMAQRLRKKDQANGLIYALNYIAIATIMVSGILIVTFDQLVTTNITPFIISSIVVGVVFLIRPWISLVFYLGSYILYFYLISLTIVDQEILLTNRVNGLSIVGLSLLLSYMLWNYNYTNISQRRLIDQQRKQLEIIAYYDPLTNLPNRRLFYEVTKDVMTSAKQDHESVLIVLDIDDFKNINDSYGHIAGDQLLKDFANVLVENIRKSDSVSRFGGDEFIILLPNTSMEIGHGIAERLRKTIMETPFMINSERIQITASFGISLLEYSDSKYFEDYYTFADKALYLAKGAGKNRIEILNL